MVVLREMQEREKALRLQKERLQKELEEKKRKVGVLGKWVPYGFYAELRAESIGKPGLYSSGSSALPHGVAVWQEERKDIPNLVSAWVPGRAAAPG